MNNKSNIQIEWITRNILAKPVTREKAKIQSNTMNEDRTNKNLTKRWKRTDEDVYYKLDDDSNTVKRIILLTSGK